MILKKSTILLADDNSADCLLFEDTLEELPVNAELTISKNGLEVLEVTSKIKCNLSYVLFLDLLKPRKNGFAAIGEIKRRDTFQKLPVVLFSATSELEAVKKVYREEEHYCISKPTFLQKLRKVIYEALTLISQKVNHLLLKEYFIITGATIVIPTKK